jgi:hypothetical protein
MIEAHLNPTRQPEVSKPNHVSARKTLPAVLPAT